MERQAHAPASYPGAVDRGEANAWTSSREAKELGFVFGGGADSQAAYPQELGLEILSKSHYRIKSLRVQARRAQAPAKIEVLYASTSRHINDTRRHDPVSRYFSADFAPCCEPVEWQPVPSELVFSDRSDQRTISVDLVQCAFMKLLVYPPHRHCLSNSGKQVCIQEIEVLGVFEFTEVMNSGLSANAAADAKACLKRQRFDRGTRRLSPQSYDSELHSALLEAGVSLDIATQIMELPRGGGHEDEQLVSQVPASRLDTTSTVNANVRNCEATNSTGVVNGEPQAADLEPRYYEVHPVSPGGSHQLSLEHHEPASGLEKENDSVFDAAIREELLRIAKQDELFNEVILPNQLTRNKTSMLPLLSTKSSLALGLLPTIAPQDRGNLLEIVMYTFGNFFSECLCCEVAEVRALAIATAERFIEILRESVGAVVAFEGAIALLRVSFQDTDRRVFQTSLHLAQTVFQQSSSKQDSVTAATASSLGFFDELPQGSVILGLRYIVDAVLANPCCWTTSHHQLRNLPSPGPPQSRAASSFSGVKRRISLDFLKFVRMVISQAETQLSFYEVLLPGGNCSGNIKAMSNQGGSESSNAEEERLHGSYLVSPANRLRLIRLLLQRHHAGLLRNFPSPEVIKSMKRYCTEIEAASASSSALGRLARDCLLLLSADSEAQPQPLQGKTKLLAKIYAQVNELGSAAGAEDLYEPVFSRFVYTSEQKQRFQDQTKQYFQSRPRPRSLYQHVFTEESSWKLSEHTQRSPQHFQKGNIAFRGEIEQRDLADPLCFHDRLAKNTRPFVFESPFRGASSAISAAQPQEQATAVEEKEISTPFAKFRGTLEERQSLDSSRQNSTTMRGSGRRIPTCTPQQPTLSFEPSVQPETSGGLVLASTPLPDTTASPASPRPSALLVDPIKKPPSNNSSSSTRRKISSAAPASLSRRSAAVDDFVQPPPATTSSSPAKAEQHPKTAPAGSKRASKNSTGDTGCVVQ